MSGWIKLHRQLIENGWLQDHHTFVLMAYCLLKAAHEDVEVPFNGTRLKIKAGQFVYGRKKASDDLRLSEQKLRTSLKKLETYGFLTSQPTNRYTVITICKWATYQDRAVVEQPANQPATNQRSTSDQPAINQQLTTYKNDKNDKNDKNEEIETPKKRQSFKPPTLEQVTSYVNERQSEGKPRIDPEAFCDWYQSNGWKVGNKPMRDWQAAVRTWEKREATNRQTNSTSMQTRQQFTPQTWEDKF